MCGIVGMAGDLAFKDEKTLAQLLIVDSLRGVDSTGIAVVSRNNDVKIAKQLGNPYELIDSNSYNQALKGANKVVIGHNRYGTTGKISRRNAHPFEFENVVGVHNGTITSKWLIKEGNLFDVDSEAVYNSISKFGLDDTLKEMAGAWTLVWWDKEVQELKMLRNEERPLWVVQTQDSKQMFWASERWMLEGVLLRNGYKLGTFAHLEKDMLHSFPIDNLGKIDKVRVRKAEGRPKVVSFTHGGTHSNVASFTPRVQQQQQNLPGIQRPTLTVTVTKKEGVTPETVKPQTLIADSVTSYEKSQEVLLEILEIRVDCHGSKYFKCKDSDFPDYPIRYYFNRLESPHDYIGEIFQADIGSYTTDKIGMEYFKVNASSVKFLEDDEPVGDVKIYPNKEGELLTYNEWISEYGQCEWCSSAILPTDTWGISTENQVFCSDCLSDGEVGNYFKLACRHEQA